MNDQEDETFNTKFASSRRSTNRSLNHCLHMQLNIDNNHLFYNWNKRKTDSSLSIFQSI